MQIRRRSDTGQEPGVTCDRVLEHLLRKNRADVVSEEMPKTFFPCLPGFCVALRTARGGTYD